MRATAISDGIIRATDLPDRVQKFKRISEEDSMSTNSAGETDEHSPPDSAEWYSLSIIEGRYVEKVLAHTAGNKQAAARVLNVDRKTLDRMIKRHNITVSRNGTRSAQDP